MTHRPSRAQLAAAVHRRVPDVTRPGLTILFVGINPGRYSAAAGHHFAGPGNQFWPTLHAAGFTPRRYAPREDRELLRLGLGITNFVARCTATAAELRPEELRAGAARLARKVARLRPRYVAAVGLLAYRIAFSRPRAIVGLQPETLAGATLWLLPNPSGLNPHHRPAELGTMFAALRHHAHGAPATAATRRRGHARDPVDGRRRTSPSGVSRGRAVR
jgi:TDG/mug DNA glycosylase family protein